MPHSPSSLPAPTASPMPLEPPSPVPRLPEERLAVATLALLVAITLLNVVTRYLTDESFGWTEELSVFLMVVLALAGACAIARRDRHIRIEFLYNRHDGAGEPSPRRALQLIAGLCSTFVFLVLAVLFARWVWDQYSFSERSMGLGLPLWWYGCVIPPLCLAASLRAFAAFRRALRDGALHSGRSGR